MRTSPPFLLVAVTALSLVAAAPSTAQATPNVWGTPIYLSDESGYASAPQVVTDGDTITAIWKQSFGLIQVASSTNAGATWSTPLTLASGAQNISDPQLVTNGTVITAIWDRFDDSNYRVQVSSSTNGGTTWSTATSLSDAGQTATNPQLTLDGGTITAVWHRWDGSHSRVQSSSSSDNGATWSTPATLSAVGGSAFAPQVVSRGGIITAIWTRLQSGVIRTQASSSTNGGVTWSAPVSLSEQYQNSLAPHLASDGTTITATWQLGEGGVERIQASSSTDGGTTWSMPTTLSGPGGGNSQLPQVATNGSTITVVWYRWDDISASRIEASSSTDGGATWGTPRILSVAGQSATSPQLVADVTTVTAAWLRFDGSNGRVQSASSTDGGATWSNPITLSVAGGTAFAPQLVTDGTATTPGATLTTVWSYRVDPNNDRIQASTIFDPVVSRLAGSDRYATAVEISKEFAPNVPVVYLATGTNYPDALSAASAAAFQDGPLLLTTPTTLPTVVSNELQRLNPALVVIVGGTGVVSAAVQNQVDDLLPAATIRRDSGVDRYATSRDIAAKVFSTAGATTAFIATGTNFPDALSASAAAGVAGHRSSWSTAPRAASTLPPRTCLRC